MITEVGVFGLKPVGHGDGREAEFIGGYVAAVDVHHFGRFDRSVYEVFVGGVERVVDFEVFHRPKHGPGHLNVAVEVSCVGGDSHSADAAACEYAVASVAKSSPFLILSNSSCDF